MPKKIRLTNAEIKKLAEILLDTNQSLSHLAMKEFNKEIWVGDFDRLVRQGEVFQCSRCSFWKDDSERIQGETVCDGCKS